MASCCQLNDRWVSTNAVTVVYTYIHVCMCIQHAYAEGLNSIFIAIIYICLYNVQRFGSVIDILRIQIFNAYIKIELIYCSS